MNLTSVIFTRESLQSNVVRKLVGERIVNLAEDYTSSGEGETSFLGQVFNIGLKLVGFAVQAVLTGIGWAISDLWDVVVEAYFELKYFDWNQTDEDLRAELATNDAALAGALGRLAGTSLVWLTGIGVSTGLSFKFPVLSGKIALELAEEGGQEIRSALTNLIIVSRQNAVKSALYGGLLTARKLEFFGLKPVTENKKPWSFAEGLDNFVESLPSTSVRSFVNQFIDSIEDSIIEMGYVISYTLDDFYLSQRAANQSMLGQQRTIELTPDLRVEDERIIIESPQELAITTTQGVIAQHQLIYNRDLGQVVGMPEQDVVRAAPQRRKLKIIYRAKESPPWKLEDGSTAKTVEVSIPDAKPSVTWTELKTTAKRYTWGQYYVTALLDNGRQMRVHCVSYNEGEQQIKELIKLSTANVVKFFHGVVATEDSDPTRRKKPTLVYPAYAKLTVGDVRPD